MNDTQLNKTFRHYAQQHTMLLHSHGFWVKNVVDFVGIWMERAFIQKIKKLTEHMKDQYNFAPLLTPHLCRLQARQLPTEERRHGSAPPPAPYPHMVPELESDACGSNSRAAVAASCLRIEMKCSCSCEVVTPRCGFSFFENSAASDCASG